MKETIKILIRDICVKEPHTIDVKEPFSRVWELFRTFSIRHVPVINDQRVVQGIVSQRDLYKTISPRKDLEGEFLYTKEMLDKFILKNVMNTNLSTLSPNDTLGKVIELMVKKKYGCIPIVDANKKLVGVVTQIDVLRTIQKHFI